jgi:hypothetical protein
MWDLRIFKRSAIDWKLKAEILFLLRQSNAASKIANLWMSPLEGRNCGERKYRFSSDSVLNPMEDGVSVSEADIKFPPKQALTPKIVKKTIFFDKKSNFIDSAKTAINLFLHEVGVLHRHI